MSARRNALATARTVQETPSESARFTATEAKNEFARALEMALRGSTVVITKHDAPKAILISMDEFKKLTHAAEFRLNTLSDEFDVMLDRMQGPKARAAMQSAFSASSKELGKAAVSAARKRG
jgi:antitoxin Phd